jgi:hypothetical protein
MIYMLTSLLRICSVHVLFDSLFSALLMILLKQAYNSTCMFEVGGSIINIS